MRTTVVRFPVYPDAIDGQPGWRANPDTYFNNHLNPAIQNCISRQIYCIIDWHYIRDYNNSEVDTATRAFGSSSHIPVPANYNGDGKTDIAVFRP